MNKSIKSIIVILLIILCIGFYSCSINKYGAIGGKNSKVDSTWINYNISDSIYKKVAQKISVVDGDTIADIGGGFGYHSSIIAKYLPQNIIYYEEDINSKVCNKRKFKQTFKLFKSTANIDNFRFFKGTATKIPFPDNFFKVVTVFISIHEFTDKDVMMTELKRILKDNGKLYIVETVYQRIPTSDRYCKIPYLSSSELNSLVEKNGFKVSSNKFDESNDTANVVSMFLECSKSN